MTKTEFLQTYGDLTRSRQWLEREFLAPLYPPVDFQVGETSSRSMIWEKTVGESVTVTDYAATDWPAQRTVTPYVYTAPAFGLQVQTEVTAYPGYPVVEYCSVLTNLSEENSPRIRNLLTFSAPIAEKSSCGVLHSFMGGKNAPDCYHAYADTMTEGSTKHFEVTGGRPTEEYMQGFNFECPDTQTGVVAVLGWAGNWKMDFSLEGDAMMLHGGPFRTDFVLLPGESYRTPVSVLLFYKGEHINGQNIWRRWLYEHNILRQQGVRDGVRLLTAVGTGWQMRAQADNSKKTIQWFHQHGIADLCTEFVQDAGWYPNRKSWCQVGEWCPDPLRFPNAPEEVAEAAHAAGLQYRMWFEPERVHQEVIDDGKNTIPAEFLIGYRQEEDGTYVYKPAVASPKDTAVECLTDEDFVKRWNIDNYLVNFSLPEAVERTIEYVNHWIDANKVDVYRQDLNINPGIYWKVYDQYCSEKLGIPRYGLTEEKYIAGLRRLWDSILERHPGMVLDECAGGGCRNDLESIRYSEPHTRTDCWHSLETTQSHTYGAAQWLVLMGGVCKRKSLVDEAAQYDPYCWRSGTFTSRGLGIQPAMRDEPYSPESFDGLREELCRWKDFARYMLFDFYPLTPYGTAEAPLLSYQYDCPEQGIGRVVTYLRANATGKYTIYPTHLEEDATYLLHDEDGGRADRKVRGADLMREGITVTAGDRPTAPDFTYCKL